MSVLRTEKSLNSEDDLTADLATDRIVDFALLRFPREFGTEETTGQVPQEFRVEEGEKLITIWDDPEGIGIRFEKGDRLAQYRLTNIVEDRSILTTDEGMRKLDESRRKLLSFARGRFPQEFGTEIH